MKPPAASSQHIRAVISLQACANASAAVENPRLQWPVALLRRFAAGLDRVRPVSLRRRAAVDISASRTMTERFKSRSGVVPGATAYP